MSALTVAQGAAAARIIAREGEQRRHLVVAVSGAHAYGFPSPDSDVDLKAIHADPTRKLLGVHPAPTISSFIELVDGVEIDYSSNEIGTVIAGVLKGNGNYIERILGRLQPYAAPELDELRTLVKASLSRRVHAHYAGFARGQLHELEKGPATVKKLLYVLRTAATGTHLLHTCKLVTDLEELAAPCGLAEARGLIARKRDGEQTPLPDLDPYRPLLERAFANLDQARESSPLPPEPPNAPEIDEWLIRLRVSRL
ncbi:MAG: nucleotidyltransferase domain-containing protein [Acidobacteriota bacterium]